MKTKELTTIIGTDVNLETCINEGYTMLDTLNHKKLHPAVQYPVFRYYNIDGFEGKLALDTTFSWDNAVEKYNGHKAGLDSFSDDLIERMKTKKPTFHDLLSATDSIDMYCGLD